MKIIYGTGNSAKIAYMERALKGLPIEIQGADEAAAEKGLTLPEIAETGKTPLENAREKAENYYGIFKSPVFSCDSGIFLWNHSTNMALPKEKQPGIHIRGRDENRRSDEELLAYYISLVKEYGPIRARYVNAVCLIWDENTREESDGQALWGEPFLLTDIPHRKKAEGFPLDSISLELKTERYFYDLEGNLQDNLVSHDGFAEFFCKFLEKNRK